MEFSGDIGNPNQKESPLPSDFIVSRRPKEYLRQGKLHCGVYSAKAVLNAYGLDAHDDPRDFHISTLGRVSGIVTPKMMTEILANHGLVAEMQTVKSLTNEQKVTRLMEEVARDNPVVLMVNNGYKHDGGYSKFWKNTILHWVTVWGYDEKKQEFYLYDPAVKHDPNNGNLPIGNVARKYSEVIRDWEGWALPIFERYRYITVKPQLT